MAFAVCLASVPLAPELPVAAPFLVGLLFGWTGAAGAALGTAAGTAVLGAGPLPALAAGFAAAIAAAVPFFVFRNVPGLGRGLPNLRSYGWLLASGALAAVLAALAGWAGRGGGPFLEPWTAAFHGFTAIAFSAPLVVVAMDLRGRRWMVPIRGEMPARRALSLAGVARLHSPATGSATRILTEPNRLSGGLGRTAGLLLAAVVGVTVLVVPVVAVLPDGGYWVILVYLVPIFWAATSFGLRGAVAVASASSLAFVVGQALWSGLPGGAGAELVLGSELSWRSARTELILFGLIGAFAGTASEREHQLRGEVVHRNHLLRQDLLRVVQALTNAVEAKDVYTEGHLRRVSDYAVRVAEELGVHGPALEMVFFASMLHDIGKIGVPEEILTKPGPLDPEEERVMQQHAEIGARILETLDVLRDAAPLVLHHQERWDGRRDGKYPGYPAGLEGEAIPLGSRIIAVVDAFDAMTTDRPYRDALPVETAIEELEREAGHQFDPRVVEVFVAQLAVHGWNSEAVRTA